MTKISNGLLDQVTQGNTIDHFFLSSPRALARRACALRALGLLLADGAPTVGGGKTF